MSLGKDLASVRKEQKISLEEIQHSIKIPIYTLESIEDDSIFESTEHNTTYIRSFIRSYARALKLNDNDIVNALDAVEAGKYDHNLFDLDKERKISDAEEKIVVEEIPFSLNDVSPPDIKHAPVTSNPDVDSVNWADLGKNFSLKETTGKGWVLFSIIAFIVLIISTLFFYRTEIANIFNSSENESAQNIENLPTPPTEINPQNEDSTSLATTNSPIPNVPTNNVTETETQSQITPTTESQINTLPSSNLESVGDVLTVAVYAAFDKLDPVRVTSDLNWRVNPYWMEQGQAFLFDFNDTLVVRGQYSKILLLFNGHVIENPLQNYFNEEFDSILLTSSIFNDPKYLNVAPSIFPNEVGAPDSLVYPSLY